MGFLGGSPNTRLATCLKAVYHFVAPARGSSHKSADVSRQACKKPTTLSILCIKFNRHVSESA